MPSRRPPPSLDAHRSTSPTSATTATDLPAPTAAGSPAEGGTGRWLHSSAWLLLLPVTILLVGGLLRAWIADDGLINVRVVEIATSGGGFTYSEGIRAETATSLLWLLVLTAAHSLTGLPVDALAVWLGLAATVGGMTLAVVALVGRPSRTALSRVEVPIGLIGYATLGFAWDFSTSGLENGVVVLWLGALALLLRRDRVPALGWVVVGLGPLLRPDLALVSAVLILAIARRERLRLRSVVGRVGVAAALPVAATVWRAAYYGIVMPNTGVAKEGTSLRIGQGIEYLWVSMWETGAVVSVLLVGLAVVALRRVGTGSDPSPPASATRVRSTMAAAGGVHLGYVVAVGGDFMVGRLLTPGLFCLALAVGTIPLPRRPRVGTAALAALLLALAVPHVVQPSVIGDVKDERAFYAALTGVARPVSAEHHEDDVFGRRVARALEAAGDETLVILDDPTIVVPLGPRHARRFEHVLVTRVLGTAALEAGEDVAVLDPIGLADPLAAHMRLIERGRPGHEKQMSPEWYVARFTSPDTPVPDALDARRVAAARRALRCGPLADLREATTADLTADQLADNLVSSFELTFFRFHPDPLVAVEELC